MSILIRIKHAIENNLRSLNHFFKILILNFKISKNTENIKMNRFLLKMKQKHNKKPLRFQLILL